MTDLHTTPHIFRLGVAMLMLSWMTACDDAPETPAPKSSEIKNELMRKRLMQDVHESKPLTVESFEMRESGQPVTLSADEKDRIIALGANLCDFDKRSGEAGKDEIKLALKIKTDKLISTLSGMGYAIVSIKITKGRDGSNFKQQIRFNWQGEKQKTECQSGNF